MNVPPHPLEAQLDDRILQGLETVRQKSGLTAFLNYLPPGGSDSERQTAARWLRARVPHAAAERLVVYPGTQTIIFNLLMRLAGRDDVVLTEALTFPGIKAAAARLGIRLIGVAMDGEGRAARRAESGVPRPQTESGLPHPYAAQPNHRDAFHSARAAVVAIIRAAGTVLIEDDAYGLLAPSVSPIANLIPERTYLATTLSKCIAPALRVSYLLAPDVAAQEDMRARLQAAAQMPRAAHGDAGDALDRQRDRGANHRRDPQRSDRPPATCSAYSEGHNVFAPGAQVIICGFHCRPNANAKVLQPICCETALPWSAARHSR